MTVKVVDASVLAAILFGEPEAAQAETMIDDADLIAPELLKFEIANIGVKKARRSLQVPLEPIFELLARAPLDYVAVDPLAVARLAISEKLSAYDASYLWLSLDQKAELLTFDQRLHAAARRLAWS